MKPTSGQRRTKIKRTIDAQGRVAGVHKDFGVKDYNVEEAQVKRAAICASQRRIFAAHNTEIVIA